MAKIKKVANGEYIGANKYTIKDAGGGKSTVDFAPDSVLTPGTEVGAELLNEMQLNALYTLDTNRVVEGQKEVYVANLEGFTDFTKPDLSFYLKINSNNTNAQTYLRIDTTDYLIKCKINDLTKNSIVACRKVGSEIIVLNNYMQRQDDAIWGGLDGGGLIEDPSVTKVVGKRYIGADGKAYICLKPSNINNKDNYMPCNVVDNLSKLQNLTEIKSERLVTYGGVVHVVKYGKLGLIHVYNLFGDEASVNQARIWLPNWFVVDIDTSAYSFAMASEGGNVAECFVDLSSFQVFLPTDSIGKTVSLSGSCVVLLK